MNRKIIAIFTALLLAASLCACNNGNKGDETTTEDNKIEIPSGEDTTADDTTKGDDQTTESESGAVVDNFEECNDTVSVLVGNGAANLRKSPSMNDSAIALSVVNGTELERVAVSSDGWSKVNYNNETYYIKTSCTISAPSHGVPAFRYALHLLTRVFTPLGYSSPRISASSLCPACSLPCEPRPPLAGFLVVLQVFSGAPQP